MSPSVLGTAFAAPMTEPGERVAALASAKSVNEVLAVIPTAYFEVLRPKLLALANAAAKCGSSAVSLRKLESHKAAKTWPPQLAGITLPQLQLTKEFLATHPNQLDALSTHHATFRNMALDDMISAKRREVEWWEEKLKPSAFREEFTNAVHETYRESKDNFEEYVPATEANNQMTGIFVEGGTYKALRDRLLKDLPYYCALVTRIELNRAVAVEQKSKAKKNLKDVADVEMGDASVDKTKIKDLVSKEVAASMSKLSLNEKKKVRGHSVGMPTPSFLHRSSDSSSSLGKRKVVCASGSDEEGEERRGSPDVCWKRQKTLSPATARAKWSQRSQEGESDPLQRQREAEAIVRAAVWRYENPLTYPDEILLIPTPDAVRILLARAPLSMVEAARFRGTVHLGPDVDIPVKFQIHISSGLRHMFFSRVASTALVSAWNRFKRTLRWRVFFAHKELNEMSLFKEPYDPDYDLHEESENEPPAAEHYIEAGLSQGDQFIASYLDTEIPEIRRSPRDTDLVDVTGIKEFLTSNNYLITPTDKNLGSAVVTREWFMDGAYKLLSDTSNYLEIDKATMELRVLETVQSVLEACEFIEKHMSPNKQLQLFLRSKIPANDEEAKLPIFYGIPKIHKSPVKMRPIVPCHSNVQAPAAKYVSKKLKPILLERPYVLRGSKDLAVKLSSLKIPIGKKIWLISGDIIAFYPNVDSEEAYKICQDAYVNFHKGEANVQDLHITTRLMRLVNKNLIMEFNGRYFQQQRGLAMGIACSPDIANLYGAYYEEVVNPVKDISELLFFGRFIDDVLGVVMANTEEEALAIAARIKYGSVELTWEASEWNTPFLDMLVYIDPTTNQVEHTPFRKALNHTERIPWSSHHPKDVKKGTFLGEMSRLATLSSKRSHYLDAIKQLGLLYIARGYPTDLVNLWIKEYLGIRWDSRLVVTDHSARDVFVLKSNFNPVWSRFDAKELGATIKKTWVDELLNEKFADPRDRYLPLEMDGTSRPRDPAVEQSAMRGPFTEKEPFTLVRKPVVTVGTEGSLSIDTVPLYDVRKSGFLDRRWLVSRKRNTNLGDLASVWRKAVIASSIEIDQVSDPMHFSDLIDEN